MFFNGNFILPTLIAGEDDLAAFLTPGLWNEELHWWYKKARKEMTAGGAGDSGAAELTHVRKAARES